MATIVALGALGGALFHLHEDFHEFRLSSAKIVAQLQQQRSQVHTAVVEKVDLKLEPSNCPIEDDPSALAPFGQAALEGMNAKERRELFELLARGKDVLSFIKSGNADEVEPTVPSPTEAP